jgi:hypothetical protein
VTKRFIVVCESCGHKQRLARPIRRPDTFYLVCHDCERTLEVCITTDDIWPGWPQPQVAAPTWPGARWVTDASER